MACISTLQRLLRSAFQNQRQVSRPCETGLPWQEDISQHGQGCVGETDEDVGHLFAGTLSVPCNFITSGSAEFADDLLGAGGL